MNTEMNVSTMSATDKTALFSQFYNNPEWKKEYEVWEAEQKTQTKKDIERKVEELEEKVKGEKEKQEQSKKRQTELETELAKVRSQMPGKKFTKFVNPNNPNEVYTTGQYKPWMKELAKEQGVNIHDKKAMANWVKDNSK